MIAQNSTVYRNLNVRMKQEYQSSLSLTGEYCCALPCCDGDSIQRTTEGKDADTEHSFQTPHL